MKPNGTGYCPPNQPVYLVYLENWILRWGRSLHSFLSCSVAHEEKNSSTSVSEKGAQIPR